MRIIGGQLSGRKILAPDGSVTRPITDRVKQSLFDVVAPQIESALVYDCFAGTGSMGLESLSRGAAFLTFFESHRPALARLNQNVVALELTGRSRIVGGDLFRWFKQSISRPGSTQASGADLVFLDPPYRFLRERSAELQALAGHLVGTHLRPDATIVFRHARDDTLELPGLRRYDLREYGEMAIEFLRADGEK
ncbi:MAG: 16S rRNA (guanine(966)-N(2))-methyltransferase RsmD [Tepidisphaeraceae bacterium]